MAPKLSLPSLLLMLAFLLVSGLSRGPGPGPGQGPSPFLRSKRANSFLLEEIFQGNLERECLEEVCNYEEAREVFEDHHLTARFWARYYDGDQCESAPCGNGGNCTDRLGGFYCTCPAPFYGETCELGPGSTLKAESEPDWDHGLDSVSQLKGPEGCQTSGPSSCEQLCTASDFSVSCSCLSGFRLKSDRRHCEPEVEFPCGQIPDQLQTNSSHSLCTNHKCPWQVSVLDWSGVQLCWGALLGHSLVLTSAHCLQTQLGPNLDPNQIFIRLSGQRQAVQVSSVDLHERFSLARHDYDLALLHTARPLHLDSTLFHLCVPAHRDHAENVLMHAGKQLLVGSHRSGARSVTLEACRQNNISHALSNKMFCLETWVGPGPDQETTDTGLGLEQDHRTKPELGQDRPRDHRLGHRLDHRPGTERADRRQNGRHRTSDSRGQIEPDLDQTRTRDRTTVQDERYHPRRESRSRRAPSNEGDKEAQNGHRQDHNGQQRNKPNTGQTGPDQDNHKVHPHQGRPEVSQDRPGPNQDRPGPKQDRPRPNQDQPRPNQDEQRVDPRLNPTRPDQAQTDPLGLIQDQTGLNHTKSTPAQTGPDQDTAQGRPQGPPQPQVRPQVRGLFLGAPAVSVDRGTAYLVGLLTSTAPAGDSTHILVFTKLSRHMTWLQGHMTPPQTTPRP